MMDINSKYYTENANAFIENTINCDMSVQYNLFLKYVKEQGKILDLGFGSGRDMLHFKSLGFDVEGIDPTDVFVENMKTQGFNVRKQYAEEIVEEEVYDGIWACASLLHVKKENLNDVFKRCFKALKDKGVLYCSFKYGEFEGIRNERFFVYLNEDSFKEIIKDTGFDIEEITYTLDVRPDRADEKWINAILRKA